jgi:hypothetical protein
VRLWYQRLRSEAGAPDRWGGWGDVDKLGEAMVIMPPSFGVREDLIGLHDVLEGRGALWTGAVWVIEFGTLPVCTQNITGCSSTWHPEDEVIVF